MELAIDFELVVSCKGNALPADLSPKFLIGDVDLLYQAVKD